MTLLHGDSLELLPTLATHSVDSVVCDPPYGLTFRGSHWDKGVPGVAYWREIRRVAKPGAYLLAFGGTRTYHRLATAIEDAGWDIRDCISWVCAGRMPKSKTALKPAHEPIVLARAPFETLKTTLETNFETHGTGLLNIQDCRIGEDPRFNPPTHKGKTPALGSFENCSGTGTHVNGRWPTNFIVDDEVSLLLPEHVRPFFYCPKVSPTERGANNHPTLKPLALMQYLVRLVTPKGGTVLDPFMGSGTTGVAAKQEGFDFVGIELTCEFYRIAEQRISPLKRAS